MSEDEGVLRGCCMHCIDKGNGKSSHKSSHIIGFITRQFYMLEWPSSVFDLSFICIIPRGALNSFKSTHTVV